MDPTSQEVSFSSLTLQTSLRDIKLFTRPTTSLSPIVSPNTLSLEPRDWTSGESKGETRSYRSRHFPCRLPRLKHRDQFSSFTVLLPCQRLCWRRGTGGGWREKKVGSPVNPVIVPFLLTLGMILNRLESIWTQWTIDSNKVHTLRGGPLKSQKQTL